MTERCWDYLGIEPTADTAVIKKAYAKQLKFNKPDKNPQGFRDLRAAYEQALNESYWYIEEEDEDEYEENNDTEEIVFTIDQNMSELLSPYESTDNDSYEKSGEEGHNFPEETSFAIADAASKPSSQHANHGFPEETPFAIADAAPPPLQYANNNNNDNYEVEDREGYDGFSEAISFTDEASVEASSENDTVASAFVDDESVWVASWEQVVSGEDAIIDGGDQRLLALLQAQVAAPRPLDEQNDFEEALLMWFADKPPLFLLSYQWARTHYQWEARLTHWSYDHYPWYMIEPLDRRYQQVSYFQLPSAFRKFLVLRFPEVASYWPAANIKDSRNDNEESKNSDTKGDINLMRRFDFFKRLFFPFQTVNLVYELNALDNELTYYSQESMVESDQMMAGANSNGKTFNAHYWQQDSPLRKLNRWVFERFIEFEDFGVIALGTAVSVFVLSFAFPSSWQNIYSDGLGVFITIALYYLFWQLQLRLFATPNTFIVQQQPWVTGWRTASIALFVMGYVTWLDIAALDDITVFTSPVYYLTHIAGMSLFIVNSLQSRNVFLKALSWHAGILLLTLAVIVPLLVIIAAPAEPKALGMLPLTPVFWLFLAVPLSLFNLSESDEKLSWLVPVGNIFLKVWFFSMIGGAFMLFAYCVDMVSKINFGFTATAIILVLVTLVINLSKIINSTTD